MTIHYHGTPISPMTALYELAGRHFCVSHAAPADVKRCHDIGQSVMLDNGAFSAWKIGKPTNWLAYYQWTEKWLSYPTTWAVIPDAIDAGVDVQDTLISQWPHGNRGVPVWHMDEPMDRLDRLCDDWPKVCIGSTAKYTTVLSPSWEKRMDEAMDRVAGKRRFVPWLHMLRGMSCCARRWPFASVDSTDIARNHNRPQNSPRKLSERWDKMQCPGTWVHAATVQPELAQ